MTPRASPTRGPGPSTTRSSPRASSTPRIGSGTWSTTAGGRADDGRSSWARPASPRTCWRAGSASTGAPASTTRARRPRRARCSRRYAAGVNAFLQPRKVWPIEFQLLGTRPEPWAPWDSLAVFKIRHVEMGPVADEALARPARSAARADGWPRTCPRAPPPRPMLILPPGTEYRGPAPGALEALDRNDPALAALPGLGRREQQLGPRRDPHRFRAAPPRGRSPPRSRHAELLLPEPPRLPRVRRDRALVPRRPRPLPLRPQPPRGLVRHPRDGGLPGRLRRALRSRPTRRGTSSAASGGTPRYGARPSRSAADGRSTSRSRSRTTARSSSAIRASGHAVSLRYTATAELNRTFDAFVPMLRAASADDLEAAMRPWVDPGNNLVFADVHGTIGYRTRGRVPDPGRHERVAPRPRLGRRPRVDGDDPVRGHARAARSRPRAGSSPPTAGSSTTTTRTTSGSTTLRTSGPAAS